MQSKAWLATLLSLLICACGGGGGNGNDAATVPAPSHLTVTETGQDRVTLAWVAPSGIFDGYNLEAKAGSEAYTQLNTALIPNTYEGLLLTFNANAPDTTYTFRIRAARGTAMSLYSNEAAYTREPNAPGQATASFDWSTGAVTLTWTRNTTGSDGLRIERAECTQYGALTGDWGQLPISNPLASTFVDAGVSQNLYYTYRITNLKGTRAGQPSTPSFPVFTGLPAAAWVSAYYDTAQGGVHISWGPDLSSTPPDGLLLERSDCDASGTSLGNWVALSLPTGYCTSFFDQAIVEGGRYSYRVTYLYGSNPSAASQLPYSVIIPLLAPVNLQVVATVDGMQLTWQNRSQSASQVVVRRTPTPGYNNDIAILSPSVSTYLDPVTSLGYYSYTVVAKNSNGESVSSAVTAGTLNPSNALVLTASMLNLPSATDATLRSSGSWAFATTHPFGVLSNNDPWIANFPANAGRGADPLIQVDRQGWPHMVYAAPSPSTPGVFALIHLWYDGALWKSESMASTTIPSSSANNGWTYRLDSAGTPHVLLDHVTTDQPYGGATASLSYLHKVSGAWVEEPLSCLAPSVSNIGTYHLSLEDSDTPHILLGNWSSVIDYVRTAPGAWSSTTVPTGSVNAGWYDFIGSLWLDGQNGWVFYQNFLNGDYTISVVQMKNGTWLPSQVLETLACNGDPGSGRCAISPDRLRIALLVATNAGFKVYHQAADGWHATLAAPNSAGNLSTMRIGFDGHQKVHVLLSTGNGYTDLHE